MLWRQGSGVAKRRNAFSGDGGGVAGLLGGMGGACCEGRKEGLETLGKGPVGMEEGEGAVVKVGAGRVVWGHGGLGAPLTPHLLSRPPGVDPSGRQSYLSGDHPLPQTHSSLHKQPMADQGSGGSRLPLALPPASQGCSSGGGGSSAGNSGHPPPPRNLQGLLQMAITAGSEEPDPPPEPMSEEVKVGSQRSGGRGALGRGGVQG